MELTNEELLGLIELLNRTADKNARQGAPQELYHPRTGSTCSLLELLKKLLAEGVKRGIVTVPPCFVPRDS